MQTLENIARKKDKNASNKYSVAIALSIDNTFYDILSITPSACCHMHCFVLCDGQYVRKMCFSFLCLVVWFGNSNLIVSTPVLSLGCMFILAVSLLYSASLFRFMPVRWLPY